MYVVGRWYILYIYISFFWRPNICPFSGVTFDGRNPAQPPGMYKTLWIVWYLPFTIYQLVRFRRIPEPSWTINSMSVRFQGPKPGSFGLSPKRFGELPPQGVGNQERHGVQGQETHGGVEGKGCSELPKLYFWGWESVFPAKSFPGEEDRGEKKHTLIQTTSHNKINKIWSYVTLVWFESCFFLEANSEFLILRRVCSLIIFQKEKISSRFPKSQSFLTVHPLDEL